MEGEVSLNNRSGFHGNHVRLTAEKIHITNETAEFVSPQMIYKTEEAESAVPIPEKVTVTKEGIAPAFLTSNLRINVPAASPAVTNDTTDTADISNVTDTTNVTDVTEVANAPAEETAEPTEEVAQMEPDRIVFQGGPGKFSTKKGIHPRMRMTSYDRYVVQWQLSLIHI